MRRTVPIGIKLLLAFLVLVGVGLNVWMFVDLEYVGWLQEMAGYVRSSTAADEPPEELAELANAVRESVLLVRVESCDGDGYSQGTAFLVEPGFVATCAHVLNQGMDCNNPIFLRDHTGIEHTATIEAVDEARDMAVLSIADSSLPALVLSNSSEYQESEAVVPLVTMGYPLLGTASLPDRAALSGEGNLSHYDPERELFVTSGLNINRGNSGGPVFLVDTWEVLSIASSKLDPTQAEGIGYTIPIDTFKEFYQSEVGRELAAK